jgi:SsrA-binding protein
LRHGFGPLPPAAPNAYIAPPMARPQHASFDKKKTVAENRRARFDYHIDETFEAGIMLTGTEVKSLRFGEGSIAESYAAIENGEAWLINSNVPEFSHGNRFNHEPKRPRKLLLKEREIAKLHGMVERKGMTLVPLSIYFNSRGRAKVELALARGKNAADKRNTVKERDWKREQGRLMREHG